MTSSSVSAASVKDAPWHFQVETYESFPLLLRYPTGIDYEALKPSLPILLTITHTFTERLPSGLPAKAYNSTLEEFDVSLTQLFQEEDLGTTVLVETFGGDRAYYKYVSPKADIAKAKANYAKQYPGEKLTWETKPDPKWTFLTKYKAQFGLTGSAGGSMKWPNDADGDVFRQLSQMGMDFTKEYTVDFTVDFETWPPDLKAIEALKAKYDTIEVIPPDGDDSGYVLFQLRHLVTYEWVTTVQKEATGLVKTHGGRCESWGVMGP